MISASVGYSSGVQVTVDEYIHMTYDEDVSGMLMSTFNLFFNSLTAGLF